MKKLLIIRDAETGEEVEVGPVTGLEVDAATPALVGIAIESRAPFDVVAAVVDFFKADYRKSEVRLPEPE